MPTTPVVTVIGGGMAGCEAAWQLAKRGVRVRLYEMRPVKRTPVHKTDALAEMVCSNSLRSDSLDNAVGLLHEEMRRLDSLFLSSADNNRVPAGKALAVDRSRFSREITERLAAISEVEIVREELTEIPKGPCIIATGPLTSEALSQDICKLTGSEHLYFYDAISPIVLADTIDTNKTFAASRYDKGGADYINCPFTQQEFDRFYTELMQAETDELPDFERKLFFEGCLPIEEIGRRGAETLLYGPMKPVGLTDPRSNERPHAVAQLRQDDIAAEHYSLVGFQTRLKWGPQEKVLRLIPGLEKAEFVRFGTVHRNTYINAPRMLSETLQTRTRGDLYFAGQIAGTEGYVESAGGGLLAGIYCGMALLDGGIRPVPRTTALGSLAFYISHARALNYQPTNITFGIIPVLEKSVRRKHERREAISRRALHDLESWIKSKTGAG
ncbi:MAG: methylenetetrahydrofolate--tRNA-(uracil(54)-C(5))-methyltransferase (FADH(2)-oxidizing) TrmFO [Acidobacteriota bacterium]|nr:methylenetetrahydrofolate--tRNA-(uracil(54)-C(5))-methyltransferase (FADH(2)-oxidizing) TrmFO [Acidobacteriota bacterium]